MPSEPPCSGRPGQSWAAPLEAAGLFPLGASQLQPPPAPFDSRCLPVQMEPQSSGRRALSPHSLCPRASRRAVPSSSGAGSCSSVLTHGRLRSREEFAAFGLPSCCCSLGLLLEPGVWLCSLARPSALRGSCCHRSTGTAHGWGGQRQSSVRSSEVALKLWPLACVRLDRPVPSTASPVCSLLGMLPAPPGGFAGPEVAVTEPGGVWVFFVPCWILGLDEASGRVK